MKRRPIHEEAAELGRTSADLIRRDALRGDRGAFEVTFLLDLLSYLYASGPLLDKVGRTTLDQVK